MPDLGKATYTLILDTSKFDGEMKAAEARAERATNAIAASADRATAAIESMGAAGGSASGLDAAAVEAESAGGRIAGAMEGAAEATTGAADQISASSGAIGASLEEAGVSAAEGAGHIGHAMEEAAGAVTDSATQIEASAGAIGAALEGTGAAAVAAGAATTEGMAVATGATASWLTRQRQAIAGMASGYAILGKSTSSTRASIAEMGKSGAHWAGLAGLGALYFTIKGGIEDLKLHDEQIQLNRAHIIATGKAVGKNVEPLERMTKGWRDVTGVAGVSIRHIERLAKMWQRVSGAEDEATMNAEQIILTFPRIRNEAGKNNKVFDDSITAIEDISRAFHKDLSRTAVLVGKALADPERGLTALSRIGVTFTKQEREKAKALIESGKGLEAQKYLLKVIESQVGGTAKAYGKTFAGQVERAKAELHDSSGEIVKEFIPAFQKIMIVVSKLIKYIADHKHFFKDLAIAVLVVKGSMIALGVAMRLLSANPIVLLATGLFLLYERSESFRKVVDELGKTLMAIGRWLEQHHLLKPLLVGAFSLYVALKLVKLLRVAILALGPASVTAEGEIAAASFGGSIITQSKNAIRWLGLVGAKWKWLARIAKGGIVFTITYEIIKNFIPGQGDLGFPDFSNQGDLSTKNFGTQFQRIDYISQVVFGEGAGAKGTSNWHKARQVAGFEKFNPKYWGKNARKKYQAARARFLKSDVAKGGSGAGATTSASQTLPATFKPTHVTDGATQWGKTAYDWPAKAGTVVGSPAPGVIFNIHHTKPGNSKVYGWIIYLKADSGVTYFMTHFDKVYVRNGQRVRRGTPLGTVAAYGKASHIHIAVVSGGSVTPSGAVGAGAGGGTGGYVPFKPGDWGSKGGGMGPGKTDFGEQFTKLEIARERAKSTPNVRDDIVALENEKKYLNKLFSMKGLTAEKRLALAKKISSIDAEIARLLKGKKGAGGGTISALFGVGFTNLEIKLVNAQKTKTEANDLKIMKMQVAYLNRLLARKKLTRDEVLTIKRKIHDIEQTIKSAEKTVRNEKRLAAEKALTKKEQKLEDKIIIEEAKLSLSGGKKSGEQLKALENKKRKLEIARLKLRENSLRERIKLEKGHLHAQALLWKELASVHKQRLALEKKAAQGERNLTSEELAVLMDLRGTWFGEFAPNIFGRTSSGLAPLTGATSGGRSSGGGRARTGGGAQPLFATGGIAPGFGHADTVPAMLTPGEIVLNRRQQQGLASRLGVGSTSPHALFGHINKFAGGGAVPNQSRLGWIRRSGGAWHLNVAGSPAVPYRRDIGGWLGQFLGRGLSRAASNDVLAFWEMYGPQIIRNSRSFQPRKFAGGGVVQSGREQARMAQIALLVYGGLGHLLPRRQFLAGWKGLGSLSQREINYSGALYNKLNPPVRKPEFMKQFFSSLIPTWAGVKSFAGLARDNLFGLFSHRYAKRAARSDRMLLGGMLEMLKHPGANAGYLAAMLVPTSRATSLLSMEKLAATSLVGTSRAERIGILSARAARAAEIHKTAAEAFAEWGKSGGFSHGPFGGPTGRYISAMYGHERVLGRNPSLRNIESYFRAHWGEIIAGKGQKFFGGWGKYLDVSRDFRGLANAWQYGVRNKQKAIFDMKTFSDIYLPASGRLSASKIARGVRAPGFFNAHLAASGVLKHFKAGMMDPAAAMMLSWYQRYGKNARAAARAEGVSPQVMTSLLALYSAGEGTTKTMQLAVRAIREYKKYGEVRSIARNVSSHTMATAILRGERDFPAIKGPKVNRYFLTALKYSDPAAYRRLKKKYADDPKLSQLFSGPVIDRHMATMMGIDENLLGKPGGYEAASQIVNRIAKAAGLMPEQVQEVAWIHYATSRVLEAAERARARGETHFLYPGLGKIRSDISRKRALGLYMDAYEKGGGMYVGKRFRMQSTWASEKARGKEGRKRHFAGGGIVPGSSSMDSVPAWLTPGELVLRRSERYALQGLLLNVAGQLRMSRTDTPGTQRHPAHIEQTFVYNEVPKNRYLHAKHMRDAANAAME